MRIQRKPTIRMTGLGLVLAGAFLHPCDVHAQSGGYEAPPSLSVQQALPPHLQSGAHFSVRGPVQNDGFLNTYRLSTAGGEYAVVGTELLKVRVKEAEAAAQLAQKSSGGQMLKSAGAAAVKPLKTGKDLITKPGRTVKGTVKGVGRFFGRLGAGSKATDPQRESVIGSLTGAASTKRKLAFRLGVDPYTQFPPLENELSRLASASAVGGTATGAGLAFVTGGAGIAISVGSQSENLRALLRDKTAAELEEIGRAEFAAMGVDPATTDSFYGNTAMTPTDKAVIVAALKSMGSVRNRASFVARAARAESTPVAFSLRRRIALSAVYHAKVSRVSELVDLGGAPMMRTAKGYTGIFPVDYVPWTRKFSGMAKSINSSRGRVPVEFWITGRMSKRAASRLRKMRWKLVENAAARLGE